MTSTNHDQPTAERPSWLDEEVWPHRIRTVRCDDLPISYTDEGEGPTLLLVHDGLWSFVWRDLIAELVHTFRVVTLDFPGAGLSPGSGRPATLRDDADVLARFVSELGLERFTLVVHDLGGLVGLAGTRDADLSGLVLMNTFAWTPDRRALRAMLRLMASSTVRRLDVRTGVLYRLTSGRAGIGRLLDDPAKSAFLGPYRKRTGRNRFHELMASVLDDPAFTEEGASALAHRSDVPALTIFGERNDPFGFQARFRGLLDGPDEMVVPGGNHFPMCDDPDGVAGTIARWHAAHSVR